MDHDTDKAKPPDPLDLPATPHRLLRLADAGILDRPAWRRARVLAGHTPLPEDWLRYLNWLLTVVGVASILTGMVFFVAYNWGRPHRLVELSGVEIGLLLVVGFAFYKGLDTLWGKLGLLAASLLTGALLVLISQDYQLGADPYDLFLIWAALITLWVAIGRWGPLWLGWLLLLNLANILYWEQATRDSAGRLCTTAILLNAAALMAYEWSSLEGVSWLRARWIPRLIAAALGGFTVLFTLTFIFADSYYFEDDQLLYVAPVMALVVLSSLLYAYQRIRRDLFMLALCGVGFVIVSAAAYGRIFAFLENEASLFCVWGWGGLLVLFEVSLLVAWLTRTQRAWEDKP